MNYKRIDMENKKNLESAIDFGKNEMPGDHDDEISINTSEISETEKEARRTKNKADRIALYKQRIRETDKIIGRTEDEIVKSKEGVKDASKGLDGVRDASYADKSNLLSEQKKAGAEIKKIEGEINKLEYDGLEIPEDLKSEAADICELKKETAEYTSGLKADTEELIGKLQDERQVFVETFIEDNIEGIKKQFEKAFRGADNRENAEDIIIYKTKKEIELAAERFIKTGDKADFGFTATLEVSSYKIKEKGEMINKKFITGYRMTIGGYEKVIRKYDKPLGSSLVAPGESKKMDDKRRHIEDDGDKIQVIKSKIA